MSRPTMTEALAALRQLPLTFFPGADSVDLEQLDEVPGATSPDPVRALYADHNGFSDDGWPTESAEFARGHGTRFTLMPVAEALETRRAILEEWFETEEEAALYTNLLPLWTDSANYMCYFLAGPLQGRLGFLFHEDPYFIQPLFRDIPAFLCDLVREARTGNNAFDYPAQTPRPEWDVVDTALCQGFIEEYLTSENPFLQQNAARNAIYLCPPDRLSLLEPLRTTPRNLDDYDYETLLRVLAKREAGELT
ncbi:hypothetical protein [Armatimonas rosea]|uniref:SMI1/KNR4 family protein n=1 Tax=Armatimonas rosea TaxID=685828 RepID=A0A7W9SPM5_ARMRO|nr:hypothetical protein [Armatimonas rosea]MBB6050155.1 hypothetical protein [Armatimonas rosea]